MVCGCRRTLQMGKVDWKPLLQAAFRSSRRQSSWARLQEGKTTLSGEAALNMTPSGLRSHVTLQAQVERGASRGVASPDVRMSALQESC